MVSPIPVICRLYRESAGSIAAIDLECNSPPWSENLFQGEFDNPHSLTLGARLEGKLVGFLVCHAVADEAHIMSFGVLKSFRGKGIGRMLLNETLLELHRRCISRVTLEVRRSNFTAKKLYENSGFTEVAVRKNYYVDNQEDALVLCLDMQHFIFTTGQQI